MARISYSKWFYYIRMNGRMKVGIPGFADRLPGKYKHDQNRYNFLK